MSLKILKWTGLSLAALIAVLLVLNAIWNWRASLRLEAKLEAIRSAGEPVTISELKQQLEVPAEQNAAVHLAAVEKELEAADELLADFFKSNEQRLEHLQTNKADREKMAEVLSRFPRVREAIYQAASCPRYVPLVQWDQADPMEMLSVESVQTIRRAFRYLQAQARYHHAEGQSDQALQTAIELLRLARACDWSPTLIGHLVALAGRNIALGECNRILQTAKPDAATIAALQAELAQHDLTAALQQAMVSERVFGLVLLRSIFAKMPSAIVWTMRPMVNNAMCYYLNIVNVQMALARRPLYEHSSPPTPTKHLSPWNVLADSVTPAIEAARKGRERTGALLCCVQVLARIKQLEQQGVTEPTLADLGLPAEATTDPFTGKPLVVKNTPSGWLIYSVGPDGRDDGGVLDENRDVGVAPLPAE